MDWCRLHISVWLRAAVVCADGRGNCSDDAYCFVDALAYSITCVEPRGFSKLSEKSKILCKVKNEWNMWFYSKMVTLMSVCRTVTSHVHKNCLWVGSCDSGAPISPKLIHELTTEAIFCKEAIFPSLYKCTWIHLFSISLQLCFLSYFLKAGIIMNREILT